VRILFGGKATVTAREHSVLVITERPGASTVNLSSGSIAVAVDKTRMRKGEVVEIRTPNAVAAIRGTVVVAEVTPVGAGSRSIITVLRGLIDVTQLDTAGRAGDHLRVVGPLNDDLGPLVELETVHDQEVGPAHLDHEARTYLEVVRVLIPAGEGIHLDEIAANGFCEHLEVGDCRDDADLVSRVETSRQHASNEDRQSGHSNQPLHRQPSLRTDAPDGRRE
jgi:hypothetical protein